MKLLTNLVARVKDWLFPQPAICTHCKPEAKCQHVPSGITADILFEGANIGTAYHLEYEDDYDAGHHLFATSIVFKYDNLDRLYMNGVVDASNQKLPFALKSKDGTITATDVYLIDGQKPIPAKLHGEETIWVNFATLDAGEYTE
jgi:hypothetical protein